MKTKIFHFASTFKAKESDDGTLKITGMASTSDTDRVGDIVMPSAWTKGGIDNYKKNPIILFNHNYSKPIGRTTSISVSDKGLQVEAKISSADKELQQLIKDEVLSTFSVGFAIKEADYMEETDGFLIKEAELFEVSVVSVPCNQEATFQVAKSFDSKEEYESYIKQFVQPVEESAEDSAIVKDSAGQAADGEETPVEEINMTPEEIKEMINAGIEAGLSAEKARQDAEKAAKEAKEAADKEFDIKVKTSAEKLLEEVEKRFQDTNNDLTQTVAGLQEELKAKADEIDAIRTSKRAFGDRDSVDTKQLEAEANDAFLLGIITGKGWQTEKGKSFVEKAAGNPGAGVAVPNLESWETLVSTSIERDIQHELILAPLFREIQMNSAVMKFPVLPDAGYAEYTAQNTDASGTLYKGNLQDRDGNSGVTLEERTLTVKNTKSVSYIGNEVEEDAIMPILPLIRESIIRSHARTVENSLLVGGSAANGGLTGSYNGLATFAAAASTPTALAGLFAANVLTGADLLTARKNMGKYGMRPSDLVYVVNERGYYELIEDTEWQDVNQVGADSMKLKGSVGRIYGTEVIVCDEFATPAADLVTAIAVNTRNFLMPRLRGLTIESEYKAVEQHRAIIATQRLGFDEIIVGAPAVASIVYGAAV